MATKQIDHTIPFTFEGVDGVITGENSDWVTYGGSGFQRIAATGGLESAIEEAVDDYFEAIAWNESCDAMNKAEARWVDNGCSSHDPGYDDNGERPGFRW